MNIKKTWALVSASALTVAAGLAFWGNQDDEREAVTLSADAKARLGSESGQNLLSLIAYGGREEAEDSAQQDLLTATGTQKSLVEDYDVSRDGKKIWEAMQTLKGTADDDTYDMFEALASYLMNQNAYVSAGISTYDFSVRMSKISQDYMRSKKTQYQDFLAKDELYYAHEALGEIDDASLYAGYDGLKYADVSTRFESVHMSMNEVNTSFVKLETALAKLALSEVKEQWAEYSTAQNDSAKAQILGSLSANLSNMNRYAGLAYTMSGGNFSYDDIGISKVQYQCYRQIVKGQATQKELPSALPPMSACPS